MLNGHVAAAVYALIVMVLYNSYNLGGGSTWESKARK